MKLSSLVATRKRKALLASALILAVALIILAVSQVIYVRTAHSTFENYYTFRGCQQLLTKTDNDATCRLSSGQVIKLVKFHDKWYLDGDLPICYFGTNVCL